MEKRMFVNTNDEVLRRALAEAALIPRGWRIKLEPPGRSLDQNALLHSLCGAIAKQRDWMGQTLDTEGWKRLLVDAYLREETGSGLTVVPSLDGRGVVMVGAPTRSFSKQAMTDLIEYIMAWMANAGIEQQTSEAVCL